MGLCRYIMLAALTLTLTPPLSAAVKVDWLFRDKMVLQREVRAPVWGTADRGERVTVTFAEQTQTAVADQNGEWMVRLDPMPACAEGRTMVIRGREGEYKFEDILVGDVWFCSGQSNMSKGIQDALNPEKELADSDYPQLRLFGVAGFEPLRPPTRVVPQHSGWCASNPKERGMGYYSAVAFFFGRKLHKELGVPVGLIGASLGGSMAEAWISREAQVHDPQLKNYVHAWDWLDARMRIDPTANHDRPAHFLDPQGNRIETRAYCERFRDWSDPIKKTGIDGPVSAEFPLEFYRFSWQLNPPTPNSMDRPGVCFNSLISPILQYGIKGVIWYQGEANAVARDPRNYSHVMEVLIQDWRRNWGMGDFPFLIVQLPNFSDPNKTLGDGDWAILREQQMLAAKRISNVGYVVTQDTVVHGQGDVWHPANKRPVGERLALLALHQVYGRKDVACSGPIYKSMAIEKDRIRLAFDQVSTRLIAPPADAFAQCSESPDSQLKGFMIAGEDRKWTWADAKIDGDTVLVWSKSLAAPVAVRYAWSNFGIGNLFGTDHLPAGPFRTDDWPLKVELMK